MKHIVIEPHLFYVVPDLVNEAAGNEMYRVIAPVSDEWYEANKDLAPLAGNHDTATVTDNPDGSQDWLIEC